MRVIRFVAFAFLLFAPLGAKAQVFRLGSDNKRTIEATTTEKISVPSDAAIVKIGFNHVADTKDAAYNEAVRVGGKIIKALVDAGIAKEEIQTESVSVNRQEEPLQKISSPPKIRYSAEQQWRIHVLATDAQKVIDLAVGAGANSVQGVEWNVADPQSLRAKAYSVALGRAKEMAEQSATQAGVRLGELISIINGEETEGFTKLMAARKLMAIEVEAAPPSNLVLYPGRVEREATVTVIYAIAQ